MRRVVLLAFVWGWSFLFIKVSVEGFTPFTVAAARMALGCLALVVIGRLAGIGPLPRDAAYWRAVAFAGIVGTALPFTLLAWGEERISSALTAVAQATTALFTALFAALLLGERLRRMQLAGLAVGMVGVGVAAGVGSMPETSEVTSAKGASTMVPTSSWPVAATMGATWSSRRCMCT